MKIRLSDKLLIIFAYIALIACILLALIVGAIYAH